MEVKEAIEFCKNQINYNYNGQNEEIQRALRIFNYGLEQVISLLQQGEKDRRTLNKLDKKYGHYLIGVKENEKMGGSYTIRDFINMSTKEVK